MIHLNFHLTLLKNVRFYWKLMKVFVLNFSLLRQTGAHELIFCSCWGCIRVGFPILSWCLTALTGPLWSHVTTGEGTRRAHRRCLDTVGTRIHWTLSFRFGPSGVGKIAVTPFSFLHVLQWVLDRAWSYPITTNYRAKYSGQDPSPLAWRWNPAIQVHPIKIKMYAPFLLNVSGWAGPSSI